MAEFALRQLKAQAINEENFSPFGQVIYPSVDGKLFDACDAQLDIQGGIPRFYIMRLTGQGLKFDRITRHIQCTQCLGSLDGKEWAIAVAPPSELGLSQVQPETINAFRIPGSCFIKLNRGTWHAGPYFEHEFVDFYNLELSDTNINDHFTCDLLGTYGLEFEIV
jgi:ureidoglycolate hydrolase